MIIPKRPRPPKNTLTPTPMVKNATMITQQSPKPPKSTFILTQMAKHAAMTIQKTRKIKANNIFKLS
jgi:hypothetical protein